MDIGEILIRFTTIAQIGGVEPLRPTSVDPTIFAAFLAGLLSFLSPCVLPLIPGYLSFISGVSLDRLQSRENRKEILRKTISTAFIFILGFSTIFILLGLTATALGQALNQYKDIISKIFSVVILIFGFHFLGIYRLKFLAFEKRVHAGVKPLNYLSIYLVGLAFAFGWTPCVGPILAAVLGIAAGTGGGTSIWKGVILLTSYSLGLAIPFMLTAIALNSLLGVFGWIKRHFRLIEIISGLLLIAVAALMFFGKLEQWAQSFA